MKDITKYISGLNLACKVGVKKEKITLSIPKAFIVRLRAENIKINQLINILLADYMEYGPNWDMEKCIERDPLDF